MDLDSHFDEDAKDSVPGKTEDVSEGCRLHGGPLEEEPHMCLEFSVLWPVCETAVSVILRRMDEAIWLGSQIPLQDLSELVKEVNVACAKNGEIPQCRSSLQKLRTASCLRLRTEGKAGIQQWEAALQEALQDILGKGATLQLRTPGKCPHPLHQVRNSTEAQAELESQGEGHGFTAGLSLISGDVQSGSSTPMRSTSNGNSGCPKTPNLQSCSSAGSRCVTHSANIYGAFEDEVVLAEAMPQRLRQRGPLGWHVKDTRRISLLGTATAGQTLRINRPGEKGMRCPKRTAPLSSIQVEWLKGNLRALDLKVTDDSDEDKRYVFRFETELEATHWHKLLTSTGATVKQ